MRRSISGRKVQTLRDRQACFIKEPDTMLLRITKERTSLSFKGGGTIPRNYGVLQHRKENGSYMNLK